MIDTPEWALERIREAKQKQLKRLDLGWHGSGYSERLSTLPAEIFELEWLESLKLDSNRLTFISPSIACLKNLSSLDLSWNDLIEIPESITNLKNLSSLDLSWNDLIEIPESITNLKNLSSLDLSRNYLIEIPDKFAGLEKLNHLNLTSNLLVSESCYPLAYLKNLISFGASFNNFTRLPESITCLHGLTSLSLGYNYLTELPKSFSNLRDLNSLNLEHNEFDRIPEVIYELLYLKSLSFSNKEITLIGKSININQIEKMKEKYKEKYRGYSARNKIREIPLTVLKLSRLETLDVSDNLIEKPPLEVVDKGIEEIKQYYRQLENEGTDYIHEAKLLILGEGGAGKTTLAQKIQDPEYKLREEDTTKGIEVAQWHFPTADQQQFCINIWDFGGQEIYHATHQFFLTKRSLYLLVADTRKEDTDFYYWMNVVELLSENSPLLIIKNEKQDRHREINERQLREQFTNLKEIIVTNLATNRGLPDILRDIKHYVTTLPHVGAALPKTWVRVREILEGDLRNYMSLEEYLNLCQQHGFTQRQDKLQLSGYLHDLGVILHFQDDPILSNTVILKPKWGTDAVYKVLDHPDVIRNLGQFTWADLTRIWQDEQYANKQGDLLQLMCKFKLCYEIPGNPQYYIAPQLLTENQPDYDWDETDNLILRYTYDFMPKGILTQFIVATHERIDQQRYVWKSGVILSKDNTKAEVIEYYGKREIKIRVTGRHKRDLLTIVTHELDKIHAAYKRLKYQKLIPCNCPACKNSQTPYFYPFNNLRERIANQKQTIECGNPPYYTVEVLSLIDEVMGRAQFSQEEERRKYGDITVGNVEKLIIQQGEQPVVEEHNELPASPKPEPQVTLPWAYRNGMFYLVVFEVVLMSVGVFAGTLPLTALIVTVIATVLLLTLIAVFQLRADDRLSEKTTGELVTLVLEQLPLLGGIVKQILRLFGK